VYLYESAVLRDVHNLRRVHAVQVRRLLVKLARPSLATPLASRVAPAVAPTVTPAIAATPSSIVTTPPPLVPATAAATASAAAAAATPVTSGFVVPRHRLSRHAAHLNIPVTITPLRHTQSSKQSASASDKHADAIAPFVGTRVSYKVPYIIVSA
jgi:hypothetical protein